ncbi:MAG: triose-phosphate isomerase [Pirellulales bacterium]|nr:triose-phosphate isomerase [Pirellulales bacterium]
MRTPLVAGNWKMNLQRTAAQDLAAGLAEQSGSFHGVEIAVFPPFVYLDVVHTALSGSSVRLGAQNVYWESPGAFTGEIAPEMLVDVGCRYVILGHSERRHILGETDADVFAKAKAALTAGLAPVICLGETLEQRESGQTQSVIETQFDGSIAELSADQFHQVTVAYEPVWAIGTGKNASPDQAEEVHADLRKLIANRYNAELAESTRILYGGSVKPGNAGDLLGQANVDGALVGGASLKLADFVAIIQAADSD